MKRARQSITLLAAAVIALSLAGQVSGSDRWNRGGAELMFRVYPSTQIPWWRINWERPPEIKPFDGYADLSYCVEDWHFVGLAWFGFEHAVPEWGIEVDRADVVANFEKFDQAFYLDGDVFEAERLPVKSYHNEEARAEMEAELEDQFSADATVGRGWGFQEGRVVSPDELGAGDHTLQVTTTHADFGVIYDSKIDFTVWPEGSEACALPTHIWPPTT